MGREPEEMQQPWQLAQQPTSSSAAGLTASPAATPLKAGLSDARAGAGALELVGPLRRQPEYQPDAASRKNLPVARGGGGADPCASQLSISEAF